MNFKESQMVFHIDTYYKYMKNKSDLLCVFIYIYVFIMMLHIYYFSYAYFSLI